MKTIQITIDPNLLEEVDLDPEAKRLGRSALIRRALREYLARRSAEQVRVAYRRGYAKNPPKRDELGPWTEGHAWPDE